MRSREEGPADLAASVGARLRNRAKQTGDDYQRLLVSFCLERFLYRLGASRVHDRIVLKGAMLFRMWSAQPYRATRDLDLLRKGDGSFAAIRTDIEHHRVGLDPRRTDRLVRGARA